MQDFTEAIMTRGAPSPYSFTSQWIYDVFINFRGEDTRHGFTGNLYNALCRGGIRTFIDDEEIRRGERISPALLKAIQGSRIAILVFSQNYAFSTFCLIELVQILEHLHGQDRLVLPIFYDVDPSDVRHMRGNYAQALAKHAKRSKDDKEKVQKWRLALHQAANLSGWHFKHGDEYEYAFIEKIVKEVSSKIDRKILHIANYPVGLETRVLEVKSLIGGGFNDRVNMIGIHGIGGSGKSTIARALYNLIADQFECVCFLADIREKSLKLGLVLLQETLLSELVKEKAIKLGDVNQGIPILKRRLREKKVLLILDDVDKIEQLIAIAGAPNWFGLGSTIIITTRDKHLLNIHGIDKKYEVRKLNHTEALELLSWNAFKSNKVDPNYMDILNCVVYYAQGLPLALEVIGSNLFGKILNEWKSALDRYKRIPNKEVQQILKVSYDCLEEDEQEIFLDIACFYRGHNLKYVMDMVQHSGDIDPRYGIGVLVDKSLIKIVNGIVSMHDLIEDMGTEIVRQESPKRPGKRSRLWHCEDIIHVLEENTGTIKIKVIIQNPSSEYIEVNWDGNSFKKMKNLRILIIGNAHFSKGPRYLPNSLRVLKWPGYPSMSFPNDFHPRKLAVLELQDSFLQSLERIKRLENLSALNLSSCQFITQIPDVSGCPNLTKLLMDSCENLVEIHDSVGYLGNLETLSATYCAKLKKFPCSIKLRYLEYLGLEGCSSLENFPEILEKMEYITKLDLSFTNLELPFSIQNLIGLKWLYIDGCKRIQVPSSIGLLPEVQCISNRGCGELQLSKQDEVQEFNCMDYSLFLSASNILDEFLPICLTFFINVQRLDLSYNNFTILPACIKECYHLLYLCLDDCKHLKEIRGIPPNIKELWARNCTSLSSESTSVLLSQKLHEAGGKLFCVPGASIPEWFDRCSRGPSFSFWFRNNFPMISLCFVVTPPMNDEPAWQSFSVNVIINGKEMLRNAHFCDLDDDPSMLADHILCTYNLKWRISSSSELNEVLLKSEWNHVEVHMFTEPFGVEEEEEDQLIGVKEIGMNVMKQGNRRKDIQFTNPYKRKKLDDLSWDSSYEVSTWYKGPLSTLLPSYMSRLIDRDTRNWKKDNIAKPILSEGINYTEDELIRLYEKLWKLQLPEKIKIFLWKALHNELAIKENLITRGTNMDDHTCPNCGAIAKSIMHTLVTCPFAEVIWSVSPLMLQSQNLPQASFSLWWEGLSNSVSYLQDFMGMLEIAGFICWRIWKCKNAKVFNKGSMGAKQVIWLVMQQVNEFQASLQGTRVEKVISMLRSNAEDITLKECNISDELLPICLSRLANVKYVDLSGNNFRVLPAHIKECRLLQKLNLNDCKYLREIRGIPPNILVLSAINCMSLSSESRNILLSQELHEVGDKEFCMPGERIPELFVHCSRGPSIYFWFRNKFPAISLCSIVAGNKSSCTKYLWAKMIINGKAIFNGYVWNHELSLLTDHIFIFDIFTRFSIDEVDHAFLNNSWNQVEVCMYTKGYNGEYEIGINVIESESRMEDIQFTDPYKRRKLESLNWDSVSMASSCGTASDEDLQQPLELNSRNLTWDPMEREYSVDMLEEELDMNDQASTISDTEKNSFPEWLTPLTALDEMNGASSS